MVWACAATVKSKQPQRATIPDSPFPLGRCALRKQVSNDSIVSFIFNLTNRVIAHALRDSQTGTPAARESKHQNARTE